MEAKYYESHITIEPVFGSRLQMFKNICSVFSFKAADLLMQKDRKETAKRSAKDTFCTGRDKDFENLKNRMECLALHLRFENFQVWRCKIEAVLIDERVTA